MLRKIRLPREASTTCPGFRNGNGQIVVRDTGWPSGTFAGQRIYQLRCEHCAQVYGANGCDIHARLCPACQGGVPGEPLREAGPSLFD